LFIIVTDQIKTLKKKKNLFVHYIGKFIFHNYVSTYC